MVTASSRSASSSPPRHSSPPSNDYSRGLTAVLVAERITGWTEPTYVNDDMMRGQMDEPRARDLYSKKYAPATEVGFMVLRARRLEARLLTGRTGRRERPD